MNVAFSDSSSLWVMIASAGPMVKFILLVLLGFSVFSWAIIIYKLILLGRVEREGRAFLDMFWDKRQFSQINVAAKTFKNTPLAGLFIAVHNELAGQPRPGEGARQEFSIAREDIERLQRVLRKAEAVEASKLEYAVPFLATTGNTAPFIGLFGTVWGIMESFRSIGAKGAASLAVVAPGISEALVATAVGLIVAIPAVIGYNHIMARIDRAIQEMSGFSADLLNIMEKQAVKKNTERGKDGPWE